ncbi:uncharacterized protein [Hyperolius riggenbachi]|uniref:uncharacterized protein n=1 Tax=Hyperolius riggenbachi TaxID=752182 RepID=UPI0035A2FECB
MIVEIEAAIGFLMQLMGKKKRLSEDKLFELGSTMAHLLFNRYVEHWYPTEPHRGQAYRCIRINPSQPVDETLLAACTLCDIDYKKLPLPEELTVWIDPFEVCARFSEKTNFFRIAVFPHSTHLDNEVTCTDEVVASPEFVDDQSDFPDEGTYIVCEAVSDEEPPFVYEESDEEIALATPPDYVDEDPSSHNMPVVIATFPRSLEEPVFSDEEPAIVATIPSVVVEESVFSDEEPAVVAVLSGFDEEPVASDEPAIVATVPSVFEEPVFSDDEPAVVATIPSVLENKQAEETNLPAEELSSETELLSLVEKEMAEETRLLPIRELAMTLISSHVEKEFVDVDKCSDYSSDWSSGSHSGNSSDDDNPTHKLVEEKFLEEILLNCKQIEAISSDSSSNAETAVSEFSSDDCETNGSDADSA